MARPVSPTPPPHGTRARYGSRSHPCKCADCLAANAAAIRAYRLTGTTRGATVQLALPGQTGRTDE